jgi:hypothetical protein
LIGVYIHFQTVNYLPLGLEKLFTNLEGFAVVSSKLKEIRRENLWGLSKLVELKLNNNELTFLESGLLDFTPKLKAFEAQQNKIAQIDARVFDNFVGKMIYLRLDENVCEFEGSGFDNEKVNEIIAIVQTGSCKDESK